MALLKSTSGKKNYILTSTDSALFREGLRDGLPIGLGYFAVAFSLGIQAAGVGLTPFQGFLLSALVNASAGEYAALTVMAALGTYLEMFVITLVANARYMLMSAALSQRFSEDTAFFHRLLIGFGVTDELFGIAISRPGPLKPFYSYGAFSIALPGWALGTVFGIVSGEILPDILVDALGVALFGMFLAIVIPPARHDRVISWLVAISFSLSLLFSKLPFTKMLSEGSRTILLTLLIAGAAAFIFPIKDDPNEQSEEVS